MEEYTLSQRYSLISLDGQDSLHMTMAKNAVCRGIAASKLLERLFFEGDQDISIQDISIIEEQLEAGLKEIRSMKKRARRTAEDEMVITLKAAGALDEVEDILACDINYSSMDMDLRAYRCNEEEYRRITESVRAEILEGGAVTLECVCLLWLFRENGCFHELFSVDEQEKLAKRMVELTAEKPEVKLIWDSEFYQWTERLSQQLLNAKRTLFKNPYLEGVNLMFPFLERRQGIFIDFVVFGTDVAERRLAMLTWISEKGHYVEEVKNGQETLLKVDNYYYRIFPMTRCYGRIPVQGASLLPVYK